MAGRVSLTRSPSLASPTKMAALASSPFIFPSRTTPSFSLASSSPTPLSSLKCLTSSSPISHLFFTQAQRRTQVRLSNGGYNTVFAPKSFASNPDQLKSAREDIRQLLKTKFCHPILIRLGWHDAGTYNKSIEEWPQRGGANGSLRFEIELKHAANAGLVNALKLLQPIKDKYSGLTYADLFQLAAATAAEEAGGPKIPMKYGRLDVSGPDQCPEEGRLPDAGPPSPADHLRQVFYRMGLNDKEIVALSGAHTLGRSRPERSGWGKPETKYTKDGPGEPGGQSWTVQWLKFDNSYFKDIKERKDEELLVLPTDAVLLRIHLLRSTLRNMPKIRKLSLKIMPKPTPNLVILEPNLILQRVFQILDWKERAVRYHETEDSSNYFLNIIIIIGVLALLTSLVGN
ncbi:hypothetical protein K1719_038128 [Acacia pycnantha]|nr:hypothetical protein K1719_038128 [Acacia pycnantha]